MSNKLVDIVEDSARGGFFLFTGNIISFIILSIGSIVVARLLGPDNYGIFSLCLVVPTILVGLIDLGISSALTRFSAKFRIEGRPDLALGLLKTGYLFRAMLGIIMSVICYIMSDFFAIFLLNRPEMGFLVKLSSFIILFQTIITTSNSSYIGLDKMQGNAIVMNIHSIVKTLLSPLLIVVGLGVMGALVGHILGTFLAAFIGSIILLKYYRTLGISKNIHYLENLGIMLKYGIPLYLSSLLALLFSQYQTIILALFASNFEVGNFSIAVQLSSLVNILIFPIGVLFPTFSKVDRNGPELKTVFRISVKYSTLLIVPTTTILAVLSKDLVYTLYGQDFQLAPFLLSIYVI
ncbi:MAG: oligosaccharide flippase family protein, partial [Nitrososphaeraceae archaeon]|nr:oligosaccharide flippase family protein [Nitrososphaeraceae archaeon]